MSSDELTAWVHHMLTRSGENIVPIYKSRATNSPSIQGLWSPYDDCETTEEDGALQSLLTPSEIVSNIHSLSMHRPSSSPTQSLFNETAQEYLLNAHRHHRQQQ